MILNNKTSGGGQSPYLCSLTLKQSDDYDFSTTIYYWYFDINNNQCLLKNTIVNPGDTIILTDIPIYSPIWLIRKDTNKSVQNMNMKDSVDLQIINGEFTYTITGKSAFITYFC